MTGRHNQTSRCPMRTASLDARCGATPEEGRRSEPRETGSSAPSVGPVGATDSSSVGEPAT